MMCFRTKSVNTYACTTFSKDCTPSVYGVMDWPYFRVMKEWGALFAEPMAVEAWIHTSYLVLPNSGFRVWEVVLDGTVTAAGAQKKNQQLSLADETQVKPSLLYLDALITPMSSLLTGLTSCRQMTKEKRFFQCMHYGKLKKKKPSS